MYAARVVQIQFLVFLTRRTQRAETRRICIVTIVATITATAFKVASPLAILRFRQH